MSDETRNVLVLASRSSSTARSATARNLERVMRERIARIGQKEIADQSQIEKTKINRLVSGQAGVFLDEIHDFLAALGLAVIESDDSEIVSLPRTEYEALCALARKSLAEI